MRIVQQTAGHLVVSRKCNHSEAWPDGFCIVCAQEIEADRLKGVKELFAKACLNETVLELFPALRFVDVGGFLVKDEGEEERELEGVS